MDIHFLHFSANFSLLLSLLLSLIYTWYDNYSLIIIIITVNYQLLLEFYFHSAKEPRNRRDSNKQKKKENFLKRLFFFHGSRIYSLQYYFSKRLQEPDLLSRKAKSDYDHIHHLTNYYLVDVVLIQTLD